jgi:hypothetical protein
MKNNLHDKSCFLTTPARPPPLQLTWLGSVEPYLSGKVKTTKN